MANNLITAEPAAEEELNKIGLVGISLRTFLASAATTLVGGDVAHIAMGTNSIIDIAFRNLTVNPLHVVIEGILRMGAGVGIVAGLVIIKVTVDVARAAIIRADGTSRLSLSRSGKKMTLLPAPEKK
jgi:hypothetical protein